MNSDGPFSETDFPGSLLSLIMQEDEKKREEKRATWLWVKGDSCKLPPRNLRTASSVLMAGFVSAEWSPFSTYGGRILMNPTVKQHISGG